MSSNFLTSFCHWASQDKIELSSEILHEARLSYLDTIACIEAGKKSSNFNENSNI